MVTVIDRLQYQPKDRNSLIDMNEIRNKAYGAVVESIKKAVRSVNTQGHRATVTVKGRVQAGRNDVTISIDCADETVKSAIQEAINRAK